MFNFIYLLTLSLEMPTGASGQISNLNDWYYLFVTGKEMSLIKIIFFKWTGERRNQCQKNVLSKCSKQLWMNSRPEIGTSKTIIVLKIASVSRIPEKSSSCGQRRKCAIWAGVLCICLFEVPSTLLILAVCKVRAINELCNGPPSPSNLCGLAVEHWSVESQGLRFNSSWELRIFLYPMLLIRQKNLSLYVCYCSIY